MTLLILEKRANNNRKTIVSVLVLTVFFCLKNKYNFKLPCSASSRGLTEISALSSFVHLRFVDLSNNYLTDLNPLATLTQLLWLKVNDSFHSGQTVLEMQLFTVRNYFVLL